MNIEQAKTIAIIDVLDKLGYKPTKQTPQQYRYFSPFRNEKTPSFNVHIQNNVWYDFGQVEGGNVIDFVCAYLKSQDEGHTCRDALRWLKNMMGHTPVIRPVTVPEFVHDEETKLRSLFAEPIRDKDLIRYLQSRGISLQVAAQCIKQVRIKNRETGKLWVGLGLPNEDRGYEIRTHFFKGCVGSKNITFIRGTQPKPPGLNVFEGFMDYLSMIEHRKGVKFIDDTLILNSLSCIGKASPYIYQYGYETLYSWLDNDKAGEDARQSLDEYIQTQENLVHKPMNELYAPHKDVNAWHMHKLDLKS
jgi:hypothetical protein